MIGAGIFPFTQAQVYVFDLTAFVYIYFAFISLVIDFELCALLRYEVIVLKCTEIKNLNRPLMFVRAQSRSCQSFSNSLTLFCTHHQLHFFALIWDKSTCS